MTEGTATASSQRGLRRALSRLVSSSAELDAQDLQEETRDRGATPVGSCHVGDRVSVAGTVRSLTLRPRGGVPALEAELYDGSGTVALVFLGRRRVLGVDCGRRMTANGRLTLQQGRETIFNPAYELHP